MRRPRGAAERARSPLVSFGASSGLVRYSTLTAEQAIELAARVEQPRSHGHRVRIDEVRDLLEIEPLDLVEVEHDALLRRELLERAVYALLLLAALEAAVGRLGPLGEARIGRRRIEI